MYKLYVRNVLNATKAGADLGVSMAQRYRLRDLIIPLLLSQEGCGEKAPGSDRYGTAPTQKYGWCGLPTFRSRILSLATRSMGGGDQAGR